MTTPPSDASAAFAQQTETPDAAIDGDAVTLIFGETREGKKFRPSDWCDRLYGALRVLEDQAEEVAEYVGLVNYKGSKCVLVDSRLMDAHSAAYRFFMNFANNNNLRRDTIARSEWDSYNSGATE